MPVLLPYAILTHPLYNLDSEQEFWMILYSIQSLLYYWYSFYVKHLAFFNESYFFLLKRFYETLLQLSTLTGLNNDSGIMLKTRCFRYILFKKDFYITLLICKIPVNVYLLTFFVKWIIVGIRISQIGNQFYEMNIFNLILKASCMVYIDSVFNE